MAERDKETEKVFVSNDEMMMVLAATRNLSASHERKENRYNHWSYEMGHIGEYGFAKMISLEWTPPINLDRRNDFGKDITVPRGNAWFPESWKRGRWEKITVDVKTSANEKQWLVKSSGNNFIPRKKIYYCDYFVFMHIKRVRPDGVILEYEGRISKNQVLRCREEVSKRGDHTNYVIDYLERE